MMRFIYIVVWLGLSSQAFAQALFNNNGAGVYVKDGGFMIVRTNSLANSASGIIDNEGTIVVEGNVTNDATIAGSSDTIRLTGNWVNNSVYTGNNGWVELTGGNQQITGSAVTTFSNLALLGGSVVKRQTINAVTSGLLQLNDAELATDVHEMLLSNAAPAAITRNNGFVSSVGGGRLSRATNSTSAYVYPTGSPSYLNAPSIYRPVEFSPATASAHVFSAALVKGDATNDGYNVNVLDEQLCRVNPNFYHRLYRAQGNDASTLRMFFDPVVDGEWTEQAHWDSPNRWNDLGAATAGSGLGFSAVSVAGVNDFLPEPFALARRKFTVDAGPDVTIQAGGSTLLNPTIGTVAVSQIVWTPATGLSCTGCENPEAAPAQNTYYLLTVQDASGCIVSDSVLVSVRVSDFLIPTAFSPNGDGVNDIFRSLSRDIVRFNMQVYNRWGELVFQTNNPLEGWDGVYKGVEQEMGVYVWTCEYQMLGQSERKLAKGNVTLLR